MRRLIFEIVSVLGVAALGACEDRAARMLDVDGAVLCPGGANCPADESYVGLMLTANSFTLAQASAGSVVRIAAPRPAEAGPGDTEPSLRNEAPPLVPQKKFCPGSKCVTDESGLEWKTPKGQIVCTADKPCVTDQNGQGVPTHGDGNGDGPAMKAGYVGWLCKKSDTQPCADLPQRRGS